MAVVTAGKWKAANGRVSGRKVSGEEKTFRPDWWLFLVTIVLLGFGIVMVFDASYPHAFEKHQDGAYWVKRQIVSAVIGLCGLFFAMAVPFHRWQRVAVPGLIFAFVLLILVHFFGHGALGAQRWIGWGPFKMQPSELSKLALVLYLAKVLAARPSAARDLWGGLLPVAGVAFLAVFLVEREPDMGTAITMLLTTLVVLYVAGARARWILGTLALATVVGLMIVWPHGGKSNYRWKRLTTFANPSADPRNEGFQIYHSTVALGSGGLTGLGFGESREKRLGNLPMQRTDFIFAIIGEEFGLVGTLGVLSGFLLLAARGYHIAQRAKDPFGSLLATGVTSMIVIPALLNIGVVTASIPTTGIPLPFISYGGSSLVPTLFGIGILLNISQRPFYREQKPAKRLAYEETLPEYQAGGSAEEAKSRLRAMRAEHGTG
ncbi:MAG: putative lipid II flippase FtsW [Capsulimonadales bacterium]|nr:putative lipid II flippase FtsW [Capsulimonadales bacterium]